ncbi:hypothetical protein RHGRI_025693 [Rhododendron griersonianum]|uniref:Uncharacterized protein n=1 Tax=Rhododendron griersonianum TaxID=479676 RepID=A0AAV6ITF2_9ERIC|nr:hypothetical protein RHGRI_025693 [Rhododendron griersonianum]
MATENLRHRIGDDWNIINPTENIDEIYDDNDYEDDYEDDYVEDTSSMKGRMSRWKAAIARHGFLCLAAAILPASLHLVDVFFLRSAERASAHPSWLLTRWITDAHFVFSSLVIGLSTWFTWAENGPPRNPTAFAVRFLAYTALSLAWDPVVFGWGAVKLGMFVCGMRALLALGIGCSIKRLNGTAGELIFRATELGSTHLFRCTLYLLL